MLKLAQQEVFEKQVDLYKKRVEKNTFDSKYRRRLLQSANGKVLEVAVGAGVNFQFYPKKVEVTSAFSFWALGSGGKRKKSKVLCLEYKAPRISERLLV